MGLSIHDGDLYVSGALSAATMTPSASSVTDTTVLAAANLAASKLEHQHEPVYSQPGATTGYNERQILHVVKGATGSVVDFRVGAVVAGTGTSTSTLDLQKNGSTILSATISLDATTLAYILKQPAGYTSTSLVTGDVLEVVISGVTAGTGAIAKGLFAQAIIREKAQ